MKIFEFLQEDHGGLSSMRLAMFIIVICFCTEWMHWTFTVPAKVFEPSINTVGLVVASLGIKTVQKFAEKPDPNPEPPKA